MLSVVISPHGTLSVLLARGVGRIVSQDYLDGARVKWKGALANQRSMACAGGTAGGRAADQRGGGTEPQGWRLHEHHRRRLQPVRTLEALLAFTLVLKNLLPQHHKCHPSVTAACVSQGLLCLQSSIPPLYPNAARAHASAGFWLLAHTIDSLYAESFADSAGSSSATSCSRA